MTWVGTPRANRSRQQRPAREAESWEPPPVRREPEKVAGWILRAVAEHPEKKTDDLARKFGVPPKSVHKARQQLAQLSMRGKGV